MQSISSSLTIAAIATPPGAGGIGIIRISGFSALSILQQIFSPKVKPCPYTSHRLYYGHIIMENKIVDEVLAVFMQAPHTYTCEDVVEIHCHGNALVLERILLMSIQAGATLAESGEFTKRAFLNGRIDLTQAEAVVDVISAKTRKGSELAQKQLAGALYEVVKPIRQALLRIRAALEVAIDFPDDEQEILDYSHFTATIVQDVGAPLQKLLSQGRHGRLYHDGISMVIAGIPNVGKSSLLNALLQEERALVTNIPGTTRDSIEETIDISGIPVRIIDTAGIRGGAESVEQLGIERAKGLLAKADLVLFVLDGTREFSREDAEVLSSISKTEHIVVVNKSDCERIMVLPESVSSNNKVVLFLSASTGEGIEELQQTIFRTITKDTLWEEDACALNMRHLNSLETAYALSEEISEHLMMGISYDLLAINIQQCLDALGDIIGESTTEDVLDMVFKEFCLGK